MDTGKMQQVETDAMRQLAVQEGGNSEEKPRQVRFLERGEVMAIVSSLVASVIIGAASGAWVTTQKVEQALTAISRNSEQAKLDRAEMREEIKDVRADIKDTKQLLFDYLKEKK